MILKIALGFGVLVAAGIGAHWVWNSVKGTDSVIRMGDYLSGEEDCCRERI